MGRDTAATRRGTLTAAGAHRARVIDGRAAVDRARSRRCAPAAGRRRARAVRPSSTPAARRWLRVVPAPGGQYRLVGWWGLRRGTTPRRPTGLVPHVQPRAQLQTVPAPGPDRRPWAPRVDRARALRAPVRPPGAGVERR